MKKYIKIALQIIPLLLLLMAVRYFENELFYDPFIQYFKEDFSITPFPEFQVVFLVANLFFRYILNAILSMIILWILFKNRDVLKVSALLYLVLFFALITIFLVVLYFNSQHDMAIFYIRRFLIQPLFLFIFIPAFYFQRKM